ncbi:sulfite exporter TauE/SafE family protein [Streptomyces albofaciens JCM 4342]|uniref:sulfite exporter TauE/SafE family protein n=1 Tax=Streptomyces albofaciens TaxID=66866 RepID=UPI00123BC43E|nr:sulfite exporter TauE/SafE family protein [Streptomyces albofaciens]KAA6221810.1 sulfite exporter TauE/SafE family protein [Streptomyces albofaciens JCM 4342]
MTDPGVLQFGALVAAALLVGVSKTAVSGVGAISVSVFAAVLPAKQSTGALLPLLLVGDVLAVSAYRRHADWSALLRLLPSVAVGVLLGAVFVAHVDDAAMRRAIGVLLLTIVAHHLWQRRRTRTASGGGADAVGAPEDRARTDRGTAFPGTSAPRAQHGRVLVFGLIAGFGTMVANAGGPAMSLYLLSAGFTMLGFLGTAAWFFLIVNLVKVPFSTGLGLIDADVLALDALLVLAVPVGAFLGRGAVHRIGQAVFERLVLVFTALSSVYLLW